MSHPGEQSERARSAILQRLRAAPVSAPAPAPDVAAYFASRPAIPAETRVALFTANATGWHAEVIETTPTEWAATIAQVLARKQLRRVLAGRNTALSAELAATVDPATLAWYDEALPAFKPVLFNEIDAGITTTRGGIAETGTLILWPGVDEPRTLSLVPPVHIAVLRASELYDNFHQAMTAQSWAAQLPTNALLVTGPSKTADIQRLLVYGAHGPRELVIVLIRDDAGGEL